MLSSIKAYSFTQSKSKNLIFVLLSGDQGNVALFVRCVWKYTEPPLEGTTGQ